MPVVFLDRQVDGLPSVFIDDVAGGRLATEHLVDLGHRQDRFRRRRRQHGFGFTSSDDRQSGYRARPGSGRDPL